LRALKEPVVYHLLGRASPLPDDYVVTEEDMLEFVYSLQDKKYRPELLFDALKANNLLIIGSTLSDWLARFFIRGAKGERLSLHRERMFLADRLAGGDPNLIIFLERYTNNTSKIFDKGATEFVDELWQRYSDAHANDEPEAALPAEITSESPGSGATIFLSYAGEDIDAARLIKDFLSEIGWIVWFDKADLHLGDNWNLKIKKAIQSCDLFLPIISPATELQPRGYFRREWKQAASEAEGIDESEPFLIPILLDKNVKITRALVPETFRVPQWHTLTAGGITPDFRQRMVQLLRDRNKRKQGRL